MLYQGTYIYIYKYLSNKTFSLQNGFTSSVIISHYDCKMKNSDSIYSRFGYFITYSLTFLVFPSSIYGF